MRSLKNVMQMILIAVVAMVSLYVATQGTNRPPKDVAPETQTVTNEARPPVALAPATSTEIVQRDATLAKPQRPALTPQASAGQAFATLSWLPPAPPVRVAPPAPPPPPVVPVAPALPFTFVGLLEQGASRQQAFLAKGDLLLVVAAGDILDNNTYRVDTLSAEQIVMTYLPLNTVQTLNIPGTSK